MKHLFLATTVSVCRTLRAVDPVALAVRANEFVGMNPVEAESCFPFPSTTFDEAILTVERLLMATAPFYPPLSKEQQCKIIHENKSSSREAFKAFNHLPLWEILQER